MKMFVSGPGWRQRIENQPIVLPILLPENPLAL